LGIGLNNICGPWVFLSFFQEAIVTKEKIVEVLVYPLYKSAWVFVLHEDGNRKLVMSGNYDDFYPGCHGIHEYGPFKGPLDLGYRVAAHLTKQGLDQGFVATVDRRTIDRNEFDKLMGTFG